MQEWINSNYVSKEEYAKIMQLIVDNNYDRLRVIAAEFFAEQKKKEEEKIEREKKYLSQFNVEIIGIVEEYRYYQGEKDFHGATTEFIGKLAKVDKWGHVEAIQDYKIDHEFEEFRCDPQESIKWLYPTPGE